VAVYYRTKYSVNICSDEEWFSLVSLSQNVQNTWAHHGAFMQESIVSSYNSLTNYKAG